MFLHSFLLRTIYNSLAPTRARVSAKKKKKHFHMYVHMCLCVCVCVCVFVCVCVNEAGPWASGLFCGSPSVSSRAALYQSRLWRDRRRLINHTFSRCRCTSARLLHQSTGWPLSIHKMLHSIQSQGQEWHTHTHTHTHACMHADENTDAYHNLYSLLLRNWIWTVTIFNWQWCTTRMTKAC